MYQRLMYQKFFADKTVGLLDEIWLDPNRDALEVRSIFALWLIRTHTEVWGGRPLDTTQEIYVDFPEWQDFNAMQTIDELVKFGIWGGVGRASKIPKDGGMDNPEWNLTHYIEDLSMNNPDNLIFHVRHSLSFHLPKDTAPPDWVTTKAFAICFYYGLWQATYHALKTFVLIDDKQVQKEKPCLWIEWDKQSVSIYNRGVVMEEHLDGNLITTDREFFDAFLRKTDEFCHWNEIDEVFRIDGPQPADIPDTWRLVIRKEKQDVQS